MSITITHSAAVCATDCAARAPQSPATDSSTPAGFSALLSMLFSAEGNPMPLADPAAGAGSGLPARVEDKEKSPLSEADAAALMALVLPAGDLPGQTPPVETPQETLSAPAPEATILSLIAPDANVDAIGAAVIPAVQARDALPLDTRTISETAIRGSAPPTPPTNTTLTAPPADPTLDPRDPASARIAPSHATHQALDASFIATNTEKTTFATPIPGQPESSNHPVDTIAGRDHLAPAQHAQTAPAANVAPREVELRSHPSGPAWREAFVAQVHLMAADRVQTAEIRLNPRELGPVDIRISINDQQANISFAAPMEETRRAIEDALPRLREVFAGAGMQLDQATVGGERQQDAPWKDALRNPAPNDDASLDGDRGDEAPGSSRVVTVRASSALVDTFA